MKTNRLLFGLLLLLLPCCVMGQIGLSDIEGDYQPIGKAKVYGKLSVQRTRNDTIRIIICDTSLFRNDDGKGAIMLYQCGDRFLIQADNAKGELLYNPANEMITISMQQSASSEPVVVSWQRVKAEVGEVMVFPNPTHGWAVVQGESLRYVDVYDSLGRKMLSLVADDSEQMQIDLRRFKSGVYVFQIRQTDCVKTVRVVVVQ
ncbi:MAG: T9SS type A sorting domain-containing protein [Bacteroidales bacterium]|nr:T9SS type A sorting domain-containing protein [Bacteroidales bacterium]